LRRPDAMRITVKLIGPFIQKVGFSERELDVPEGTTADNLLDIVQVDRSWPKVITRNGRAIASNELVEAGDRVVISPIYSGG
jgi:molybdopterin converting factor small subunit